MSASFSGDEDDVKVLTAGETAEGRLDAWLASGLDGALSRSRIKSLIEQGAVSVNGLVSAEPKRKIQPGDRVVVSLPEPDDAEPSGENIPLEILYEDSDVIVLVKPAGLVVHPGAGNWSGTLVNALIHHCGDSLSGIGGVRRPGIVHRLDKDTSGVMVAAKNDLAHRGLAAQFADHGKTTSLERAYHAIVWGTPSSRRGTIDAPLGRAADRVRRAVVKPGGADARHAVTHYDVVEKYHQAPDGTALAASVQCRLETGRTHQIRVHMAHIGHPLIGDPDYGAAFRNKVNRLPASVRSAVASFPRQALHAYLLQFEHPVNKAILRYETPLPDDLKQLTEALTVE
jgi:23S rRNA pseudouridine1911/1915/1917 synthase